MQPDQEQEPSRLSTRRRAWWLVKVLASLVITGLVLTWALYRFSAPYQHAISAFACVGERFFSPQETPPDVFVFRHSSGYDGQFFYYLAKHPWTTPNGWKNLDLPPYRFQRIGYPLLARTLALGNPSAIPYTLLAVNLLSIAVSIVLLSFWFRERAIDPLYAMLFAFSGTLIYPLLRDLSEVTVAVFMLGGLFAYFRRRYWLSGALLGYAMLCKELSFGIALVLVVDGLFLSKQKRSWIAPLLSSFIMFGWHACVYVHTNATTYPFHGNFGTPIIAMIRHVHELFVSRPKPQVSEQLILATVVLILVVSMATAIWEFKRSRHPLSLCLLGYSFMPLAQNAWVWIEPWGYCRMLVPSLAMLVSCFACSGSKWYLVPLSLHAVLFVSSLAWLLP